MKSEAYWISPYGKVIPVDLRHINQITMHPDKFGLTHKYIEGVYAQNNEQIGTEGNAREEIMVKLIANGWIRMRYNKREDGWIAQLQKYDKKSKMRLFDFVMGMMSGTIDAVHENTGITILDASAGMLAQASFKDILRDLSESEKRKAVYPTLIEDFVPEFVSFKEFLLMESSLSRLYKHMQEHDTGTITAYRSNYTHKENQQRNRSLSAKLSDERYNITSVKGAFIENYGTSNSIEVGEHVFFVVDINDTGKLESVLRQLGEDFDQDSIMMVPKGGTKGILWGTTKRLDADLKYGQKKVFPNAVWGSADNKLLTRVNGRPFYFKENSELIEKEMPEGYFGRYACHAIAITPWRELEI